MDPAHLVNVSQNVMKEMLDQGTCHTRLVFFKSEIVHPSHPVLGFTSRIYYICHIYPDCCSLRDCHPKSVTISHTVRTTPESLVALLVPTSQPLCSVNTVH